MNSAGPPFTIFLMSFTLHLHSSPVDETIVNKKDIDVNSLRAGGIMRVIG